MNTNRLLVIFVSLLAVLILFSAKDAMSQTWYVDNQAIGSNNGVTWSDAWNGLSGIQWAQIKPGDTIEISGGATQQVYSEGLVLGASGTTLQPIRISVGTVDGRNGVVVITNTAGDGINIHQSYITVDGLVGSAPKIRITGNRDNGIVVEGSSVGVVLSGLEVDNNGTSAGYNGIYLYTLYGGSDLILEVKYCKLHDNYQDQMKIVGSRGPHGFGRVLVHHNEIYNLNDDGLELSTVRGLDFFNNNIHTMVGTKGSGHLDGLQSGAGDIRVFNNRFWNLLHPIKDANSYIRIGLYGGSNVDAEGIYVYNNVITEENFGISVNYLRGLELSFSPTGSVVSINNVIVANNTIAGMPFLGMGVYFGSISTGKIRNVSIKNNILYNNFRLGGGEALDLGNGNYTLGSHNTGADVEMDYNIIHHGPEGNGRVGYRGSIMSVSEFAIATGAQEHFPGEYDPMLNSNYAPLKDSPVLDGGVGLDSFFDVDINGDPRPLGTAWDVGAYEGERSIDNIPPVSPTALIGKKVQ